MRFIVCGGRDYSNALLMRKMLSDLHTEDVLVHGAARGADMLAASSWMYAKEPHPADWDGPCRETCPPNHRRRRGEGSFCPMAGLYRNQEMLDTGVDLVIAFPGGRGTADMVARAEAAGVEVWKVRG